MKNGHSRKRGPLNSAVRALAKLVRKSARRVKRSRFVSARRSVPAASVHDRSPLHGNNDRKAAPHKSTGKAAMAVEDGFKEF
jgi:hypothetical protein